MSGNEEFHSGRHPDSPEPGDAQEYDDPTQPVFDPMVDRWPWLFERPYQGGEL